MWGRARPGAHRRAQPRAGDTVLAHPLLLRSPCALFLHGLQGGGAISAAALIIISASKPPGENQAGTGTLRAQPQSTGSPRDGVGAMQGKARREPGVWGWGPPPGPAHSRDTLGTAPSAGSPSSHSARILFSAAGLAGGHKMGLGARCWWHWGVPSPGGGRCLVPLHLRPVAALLEVSPAQLRHLAGGQRGVVMCCPPAWQRG